MSYAWIGIGSNLGNRKKNIRTALKELCNSFKVLQISSPVKSKPYGELNQADFINLAISIETHLDPQELLHRLLDIENRMGRIRTRHWGPRIIDLDLLLYEDAILDLPDLILPHPDLHNRLFVLQPLNEIAPNVVHPKLKKNIHTLYQELIQKA